MKYGVYDTVDNVWIGDKNGPKLFEDQTINGHVLTGDTAAQIAAQMVDKQLKVPLGRHRSKAFTEESVHLKDEKKTTCTPEEALDKIMDGSL